MNPPARKPLADLTTQAWRTQAISVRHRNSRPKQAHEERQAPLDPQQPPMEPQAAVIEPAQDSDRQLADGGRRFAAHA
jgi:hypothetical protein